jgi:IS5 family transposase
MSQETYRVRNWKEYNAALVKRGSVTLWFDEEAIKKWSAGKSVGKRGRPKKYSDMAIECGLTLKAMFKLTFRGVEGFIGSLVKSLKLELDVPDYTLICKRQKTVLVSLPKQKKGKEESLHIVVDSTGLKVFGEGEWKVRQHGWVKHRLWRKLHLAINQDSQEIESFELTDLGIQDCEGLELLIDKLPEDIDTVIGDGAYDRFSCYEKGEERKFKMIAPPQRNAKTSKERSSNKKKASEAAVKKRDEAIKGVREKGRKEWKIEVGYHKRSLAETAMFRIKKLFGNRLTTRITEHQKTEIAIWCRAINKMTSLGMPQTVRI